MFLIVGITLVIGCVIGGFMVAGGNPLLLWQPSEFIVILGAAAGALCISSSPSTLKKIFHGILSLFRGNPYTHQEYLNLLKTLFEFFNAAAKDGFIGVEQHVDDPEKSAIFSKNRFFISHHEPLYFLIDTVKLLMVGTINPNDLEAILDQDLEVLRHEAAHPVTILGKISDSLPGLGIVAAVLGIIVTMQSIGGSVEEVGKHVASALVGTFLGVLACYGFFQPFSTYLEVINNAQIEYVECIKAALLAYSKGTPPPLVVEIARRSIPVEVRPSFSKLEQAIQEIKKGGRS